MAELLFEIFCEEIPARMQVRAGADLAKALTEGLTKAGLTVDNAQSFTGPRRLVFAADIPLRSPDISEERKGPRVGSPEQALAGFLRGAGLSDIAQAEMRTDPKKGEYYVAVIEKAGAESTDIIAALIPAVMNNFPWPKSMKSGSSSFRWVRPLQSMICLLGGKVVPFTVGGVATGDSTEGHRRHGKGPFKIKSLEDYVKTLESKAHVILSADARKDLIITQARKACTDKGLELVEDEGLLNEVAGLAEWPVVILGDMDPSFLQLPGEVIRLSMRTHQKYFAVRNPKTGKLAPNFIVVANQAAPDGGKEIAKGNSKVLSARLADAQFFQSEDAKKKLIDYYDKLDTVVFHKKLGSIRDKAERVAALARELAPKVGADPDAAEQAAKLAKCDLVTNMVTEFTSLQGQIGRGMYEAENTPLPEGEGARRAGEGQDTKAAPNASPDNAAPHPPLRGTFSPGEKDSIAAAIEDHYKPQGPSDTVPTNPVAVAVALADKLDTLVGFWAIDEKPTGSKDPYALRRAALGVVRIILENDVRLQLSSIFNWYGKRSAWMIARRNRDDGQIAVEFWDAIDEGDNLNRNMDEIFEEFDNKNFDEYLADIRQIAARVPFLVDFIADRLKAFLRDKGIRHDLIDAVFAPQENGNAEDDLVAIVNRANALQSFLSTDAGENLLAGYKRAANILKAEAKKGDLPEGAPDKPSQAEAAALYTALQKAAGDIEAALAKEAYSEAMTALSTLRAPIDGFFDNVMVVAEDKETRENNLRLLGLIRDTARQIVDFDRISG